MDYRSPGHTPPAIAFTATLLACALTGGAASATSSPLGGNARRTAPFRSQANVDWPQLGFDAGHSGFNPHEHQISPQTVHSLTQLWSYAFGSGNWVGDMAEVGGTLFVPVSNGELYAFNAATGAELWTFSAGIAYGWNTGPSGVAVDNGLAFTVCDLAGGVQGLCALSAQTGIMQWSFAFTGSGSYAGSPPVVANGTVYFEACDAAGCAYVALNESTGVPLWYAPELCSGNLGIPPSVYQGFLYVGEGCGTEQSSDIVALSIQDGSRKWKRRVVGVTHGLTVADGVIAYMRWNGTEAYLGALDAKRGRALWGPVPINNVQQTSMPAIAYKQIYAWIFINDYGYVADYDKRLGAEYWNYTIARSFPTVANHIVWIAFNGTSLALDAGTGQYLWNVGGTDNLALPIVVNGVVYGGCNGSNVCAYVLSQGRAGRR